MDFEILNGVLKSYSGNETFVSIPYEVTEIGNDCFKNNTKVEHIFIPYTVKKIGDSAFLNCYELGSVTIPEGIEEIGQLCFCNCNSLGEIILPSTLKSIGLLAFAGCHSLRKIEVSEHNEFYFVEQNCLVEKANSKAIKVIREGKVPKSEKITQLCAGAFYGSNFSEITIPNTILLIFPQIFTMCKQLQKVSLPFTGCAANPEAVGLENKFSLMCNLFSAAEYEGGVKVVSELLKTECYYPENLKCIEITGDVLQELSFDSLPVEEVVLSGNANEVPVGMFNQCSKLNKVVLSNSIKSIGEHAFRFCESLNEVVCAEDCRAHITAFWGCKNTPRELTERLAFGAKIVDEQELLKKRQAAKQVKGMVAVGFGFHEYESKLVPAIACVDMNGQITTFGAKYCGMQFFQTDYAYIASKVKAFSTYTGDYICAPIFLGGVAHKQVKEIIAGLGYNVSVMFDGTVVGSGKNDYSQLPVGWSDIMQVACGNRHTVGLKNNGTVISCGNNKWGQLDTQSWEDIVEVACTASATLGLTKTGGITYVGGFNTNREYEFMKWHNLVSICASGDMIVGLDYEGKVKVDAVGINTDRIDKWEDIVWVTCFDGAADSGDHTWMIAAVNKNGQVFVDGESTKEDVYKLSLQLQNIRLFDNLFNLYPRRTKNSLNAQQAIWRKENLCQHCGCKFKGIFSKSCTNCGEKKDY